MLEVINHDGMDYELICTAFRGGECYKVYESRMFGEDVPWVVTNNAGTIVGYTRDDLYSFLDEYCGERA